jgi:hypothetical protein
MPFHHLHQQPSLHIKHLFVHHPHCPCCALFSSSPRSQMPALNNATLYTKLFTNLLVTLKCPI